MTTGSDKRRVKSADGEVVASRLLADQQKIREFYYSAQKLSEEIGIDQKQAFWAHVTLWAVPDCPTSLDAQVFCECK